MIDFTCPHCKKILRVPDQFEGKSGKCNHCGNPIKIARAAGPPAKRPNPDPTTFPSSVSKWRLNAWLKKEAKRGVPRQFLFAELISQSRVPGVTEKEAQVIREVANELRKMLEGRNAKAAEFEKTGKIEKAIALYQENCDDCFAGPFPYDRLRIIYSRQQEEDKVIAVCRQFLSLFPDNATFSSHLNELLRKRGQ